MKNVVVFDTETTGLIEHHSLPLDRQPRIFDLYAQRLVSKEGLLVKDEILSVKANPQVEISKEVIKVTGVNPDDLRAYPLLGERWGEVREFFASADTVVAHNFSYDYDIMNFEQRRIDNRVAFPWPKRKICTVEATEFLKGYRLKLGDLYEYCFEKRFENAHTAKADVDALSDVFTMLHETGKIK